MSGYTTVLVGSDGSESSFRAVEGGPVDEPIRLAERRQVGLVVVGNQGLNSLASRLLGSVPASISHREACDVLVGHSTGRTRM